MHRVDTTGHVAGMWSEGNPGLGQTPTRFGADWFNDVQENLVYLLTAAGNTPVKGRSQDVHDAIVDLIGIHAPAASYATATSSGLVELATSAEAQGLTDATRVITPATLASVTASSSVFGLTRFASGAEVQGLSSTGRSVTPAGLAVLTATESRTGLAELATTAEAKAGTDDTRIITPLKLAAVTQSGSMLWSTDSNAAGNTLVATLTPALTAYAAGVAVLVKPNGSNTGAATLNVNGLGAVAIKKGSRGVVAGEIADGEPCWFVHDGTNFQLVGAPGAIGGTGYVKLGDGTILQWGTTSVSSAPTGGLSDVTVAFPVAFPTAVLNVQVTADQPVGGIAGAIIAYYRDKTTTGVTLGLDESSATPANPYTVSWYAIGR